jgi:hypothetical protein
MDLHHDKLTNRLRPTTQPCLRNARTITVPLPQLATLPSIVFVIHNLPNCSNPAWMSVSTPCPQALLQVAAKPLVDSTVTMHIPQHKCLAGFAALSAHSA